MDRHVVLMRSFTALALHVGSYERTLCKEHSSGGMSDLGNRTNKEPLADVAYVLVGSNKELLDSVKVAHSFGYW